MIFLGSIFTAIVYLALMKLFSNRNLQSYCDLKCVMPFRSVLETRRFNIKCCNLYICNANVDDTS